ncbi:hypothetical protein [Cellulomonas sp. RIT-PI-Y]|uniref:hypothetical protein n=1 Tax=Cellulomonas sp. RIT-PI-Y TaxID=3035297 RepID=UPI0021D87DD3|nr:hypothetical protein [Cellulomonas sp. RIT-PI-Y]
MHYVTWADDRGLDLRGADISPHLTGVLGGLLQQQPGAAPRILTGIVSGPVNITVQHVDRPPVEVADGWEDVVEVSCRAVADLVVVAGPYADDPAGAALNPPGAASFRLRAHARHRDMQFDLTTTEPHEEYLLITWPDSPAPARVLATGSRYARRSVAASSVRPPAVARRRTSWSEADSDRLTRAQENLLALDRDRRHEPT